VTGLMSKKNITVGWIRNKNTINIMQKN